MQDEEEEGGTGPVVRFEDVSFSTPTSPPIPLVTGTPNLNSDDYIEARFLMKLRQICHLKFGLAKICSSWVPLVT